MKTWLNTDDIHTIAKEYALPDEKVTVARDWNVDEIRVQYGNNDRCRRVTLDGDVCGLSKKEFDTYLRRELDASCRQELERRRAKYKSHYFDEAKNYSSVELSELVYNIMDSAGTKYFACSPTLAKKYDLSTFGMWLVSDADCPQNRLYPLPSNYGEAPSPYDDLPKKLRQIYAQIEENKKNLLPTGMLERMYLQTAELMQQSRSAFEGVNRSVYPKPLTKEWKREYLGKWPYEEPRPLDNKKISLPVSGTKSYTLAAPENDGKRVVVKCSNAANVPKGTLVCAPPGDYSTPAKAMKKTFYKVDISKEMLDQTKKLQEAVLKEVEEAHKAVYKYFGISQVEPCKVKDNEIYLNGVKITADPTVSLNKMRVVCTQPVVNGIAHLGPPEPSIDGLTHKQIAEAYERNMREPMIPVNIFGLTRIDMYNRTTLTPKQKAWAQENWSAQLRVKQNAVAEKERNRVVCQSQELEDDNEW